MPGPECDRGSEVQETSVQPASFAAAPEKAVPVNAQDAAKGQKRPRDDDNEADDDADMDMDVSDGDSD